MTLSELREDYERAAKYQSGSSDYYLHIAIALLFLIANHLATGARFDGRTE